MSDDAAPWEVEVDGRTVAVSHPDKVLWPEAGVTKADLATYHRRIAPMMLPHLVDRPLALLRAPDGLGAGTFFQKQRPSHLPEWVGSATLARRTGGEVDHVVAEDAADLVVLADLGCVELHALLCRAGRPDRPVEVILDLDPSTEDLGPVRTAAKLLHHLLRDLDAPAFVKSSGSRGLHIHVPIRPGVGFDVSRRLARALAERAVAEAPDELTTRVRKADRGDRLFVDTLRNGYGQHAVVPYGVRARPEAPVAVPLDWAEAVAASFDPRSVTLRNVFRRLGQKRDPWDGFGRRPVDAAALLDRLAGEGRAASAAASARD